MLHRRLRSCRRRSTPRKIIKKDNEYFNLFKEIHFFYFFCALIQAEELRAKKLANAGCVHAMHPLPFAPAAL
jgi:hypothetical protein